MTRICCLTLAFVCLAGPGLAGDRETAKEAMTRIQEAAARPDHAGFRGLFTDDAFGTPRKGEAQKQRLALAIESVGRSLAGVDWDAPDDKPVHLVFLLLTPEQDDGLQLQILAAIARGMANADAREHVASAESHREVWAALKEALRAQELVRVTS